TAATIHARERGLDAVTHLEILGGILDALLGDVVGTHVALDTLAELDHRTLGVHFLDRAGDDGIARIGGHELAERILLHLLDAQRDALALGIDSQHHGLDFLALLEVADQVFAAALPRDV